MSQAFIRPLGESPSKTMAMDAALAKSTDLMEALLAAGAIMAHADGEMAGAERRKILALVRENPLLSAFSHEEVVEEIVMHEANYRMDPEVAFLLAREKLVRVAGQRRLCRLIVEACRAIVPADGVAHPSEYRALAEIRALLDVETLAHRPEGRGPVRGDRDGAGQA